MTRKNFKGHMPPPAFTGDGCTCAPDIAINGADLREACRWHDWAYLQGGDESNRKIADRNFLHNLKASGCPFVTRHFYYRRVRFWGVLAFNYWSKRPSFRELLAVLVQRYWETE